jgi:hypothetical protein
MTVEALQYRHGQKMEDGFYTEGELITCGADLPEGYVCPCKFRGYPYINGSKGPEFLQKGDRIVRGHKGNRFVVRPDDFQQRYEHVPSDKIPFSRTEFQNIRARADEGAKGWSSGSWKRAWEALSVAADHLDAMLARTEIKVE